MSAGVNVLIYFSDMDEFRNEEWQDLVFDSLHNIIMMVHRMRVVRYLLLGPLQGSDHRHSVCTYHPCHLYMNG